MKMNRKQEKNNKTSNEQKQISNFEKSDNP